jgi:hypothetical protein
LKFTGAELDTNIALKSWLESMTDAIPIWQEADKKHFFCTHEGFEEIERHLGRAAMQAHYRDVEGNAESSLYSEAACARQLSTDPDHA